MTIEETWEKLGQKLKNHRLIKSNSATASCPAHKDGVPSLSLKLKKDIILFKCHAGCTFSEITKALGMSSSDFKFKKKLENLKRRSADTHISMKKEIFLDTLSDFHQKLLKIKKI